MHNGGRAIAGSLIDQLFTFGRMLDAQNFIWAEILRAPGNPSHWFRVSEDCLGHSVSPLSAYGRQALPTDAAKSLI